MKLQEYPRPKNDNGLGIHTWTRAMFGDDLRQWFQHIVDMRFKWVTTIQTDLGFMQMAAQNGIYVNCRPFVRASQEYGASDDNVVEHMLEAGIPAYVQLYNEPELSVEWEVASALSINANAIAPISRDEQRRQLFERIINREQRIAEPSALGVLPMFDDHELWQRDTWANRWMAAASWITNRGGYPGIQSLDPEWLRHLLRRIKNENSNLLDKAYFVPHNYAGNHPTDYPYDSLNHGKTIYDDWFAYLSPLKYARVFQEEVGFVPPMITGEGGWCYGNSDDNRYPKTDYIMHRDYHVAGYEQFRTGIMPNGEKLPDYWFANCYWLLAELATPGGGDMGFEENAWISNTLSGTKQMTIDAVKAIPPFVRKFSWDSEPIPQPDPIPTPEPQPEVPPMPEFRFAIKDYIAKYPGDYGSPISEQIDLFPNEKLTFQPTTKGMFVYQYGTTIFLPGASPKV